MSDSVSRSCWVVRMRVTRATPTGKFVALPTCLKKALAVSNSRDPAAAQFHRVQHTLLWYWHTTDINPRESPPVDMFPPVDEAIKKAVIESKVDIPPPLSCTNMPNKRSFSAARLPNYPENAIASLRIANLTNTFLKFECGTFSIHLCL